MNDRPEVTVDLEAMENSILEKSVSRTASSDAANVILAAKGVRMTADQLSSELQTSSSIPKCEHGVYKPHELAEDCGLCNPDGNPNRTSSDTPHFNRRSALTMSSTGKLPHCPDCNTILTVSNGGKCIVCHGEFVIEAPEKLRANNKVPGLCPECSSGVHYEKDAKTWVCCDCDFAYKAPKRMA